MIIFCVIWIFLPLAHNGSKALDAEPSCWGIERQQAGGRL
jgi:hypothetical protein